MIRFEEKSYSAGTFRPRPEIHIEPDGSLLIVATPWGARAAARKAVRKIQDYFLSIRHDVEATSPFSRLACLSAMGNDLRVAVKLASDSIYNEDNRAEYVTAIELFVLARSRDETVWIQVGHPFALLDRPGENLISLGGQQDLSTEFSKPGTVLSPLPTRFVGTEKTSDFAVESIRTQPADKLILVSSSFVPATLYSLPESERTLQSISTCLAEKKKNQPFWLGLCHFS